jgi:hypothetical protein
MNWRRGLFRLWIAASLCWITLVGWEIYEDSKALAEQRACLAEREANPGLGNPFECFKMGMFEDLIPVETRALRWGIVMALPPLGALFIGLGTLWVISGFAPRGRSEQ